MPVRPAVGCMVPIGCALPAVLLPVLAILIGIISTIA